MAKVTSNNNNNINNKEYKEIYDKENNMIIKIKRPTWISDETVTICKGCNQYFSHFKRKHHCRNCGNIFCQNCSSNTVALPFLGYHRYVRVCKRCLKLVELINKCLSKNYSIVEKLNCEYEIFNTIRSGDEITIGHFVNYGGINILNYFCNIKHPAFCHLLLGIIINHLIKCDLSKQSYRDLLDIFIKLTEIYIENIDKIIIDTKYLLFLLQNIVVFIMHTLTHVDSSKITEGQELRLIKILLHFSYLDKVYEKINKENENDSSEKYIMVVNTIEKIISKSLSEFCKRKENQYAIFQNPEVFDLFYKGLNSPNDESRKYLAKSLAYLSLRNDQYKLLILKGSDESLIKKHVDTLVKCIILDPEKFPDILNNFCNCCYTEYLKEMENKEEDKEEHGSGSGSYLSHSYSPKGNGLYKISPQNTKNSTNNIKHNRHRSTSSTLSSPIIKKKINIPPKTPIVSNLTKGLNSPQYKTKHASPLSRSISGNFDIDIPSPSPSISSTPKDITSSSLPLSFGKLSLKERKAPNGVPILTPEMIRRLKFQPDVIFSTNVLNSYLNEFQNHTSSFNLAHEMVAYNTMISHIVCTLANLICQSECEGLIMENDQIVFVLCLLIETHVKLITNSLQNKQVPVGKLSTSLDITRHASRALGNIALNQNNIEMLFSLCTTKQPHIISALYSLLSLNDEAIQRQTLRIVSNIYSKKSINDLTLHSETINNNLDSIQALIPQDQDDNATDSDNPNNNNPSPGLKPEVFSELLSVNSSMNIPLSSSPQEMERVDIIKRTPSSSPLHDENIKSNTLSPTHTLVNSISSITTVEDPLSSSTTLSGDKNNNSNNSNNPPNDNLNNNNNNNNSALPPLISNDKNIIKNSLGDHLKNNKNTNFSSIEEALPLKNHDKNYKRNSLQCHLSLNASKPINQDVMMAIDPDSLTFLYHIKYILRFIPIVTYCKDYGCTAEIKRKATSVLNKLKIIVINYNINIKPLN